MVSMKYAVQAINLGNEGDHGAWPLAQQFSDVAAGERNEVKATWTQCGCTTIRSLAVRTLLDYRSFSIGVVLWGGPVLPSVAQDSTCHPKKTNARSIYELDPLSYGCNVPT